MINIDDQVLLRALINDWEQNPITILQKTGIRYYYGDHDIYYPSKPAGKSRYNVVNGVRHQLTGLVNSLIVDNMYAQMVNQKVNYLFSKPLLIECENQQVQEILKNYFGKEFLATIKELATEFINCGIAYLHPYYTEEGEFKLEVIPGSEVIPIWKDRSHNELQSAIRIFENTEFDGIMIKKIKYAVVFKKDSTRTYRLEEELVFVSEEDYVVSTNPYIHFEWGKVPLIPFKANTKEIPLIQKCKSIQDNLNMILSVYQDALLETQDTSLIAITGAGGENPGELRHNLSTYRLVYLQNNDNVPSDIKVLQTEVKNDNYELLIKLLRRSLVENCSGFEIKDEREKGNNLNEMNIKSMYVNLDLDANNIETEFQNSIRKFLYFLNIHFRTHGLPIFDIHDISIITDRDMIVNLKEQVEMAVQLHGKISKPTFLSMLSVVPNVQEELERIKEENNGSLYLIPNNSNFDNKSISKDE